VSLPVAASIGREAFSGCTSLALVSLGSTAPTLNLFIFSNINTPITVTVTVPSGATGYGTVPTTYSSDTSDSWGNTFRAKGWDGTSYFGGTVNTNITLKIEAQP
jgi:hypothetical protein